MTLHSVLDQVLAYRPILGSHGKRSEDPDRYANRLNGKEWLKNSISVWSDIAKNKQEKALRHPAVFPEELVGRLLDSFLNKPNQIVLDPFMGMGSTLAAACKRGHRGIGFELYAEFSQAAVTRLLSFGNRYKVFNESAFKISTYIKPNTIDMVVTSPPYWNILLSTAIIKKGVLMAPTR